MFCFTEDAIIDLLEIFISSWSEQCLFKYEYKKGRGKWNNKKNEKKSKGNKWDSFHIKNVSNHICCSIEDSSLKWVNFLSFYEHWWQRKSVKRDLLKYPQLDTKTMNFLELFLALWLDSSTIPCEGPFLMESIHYQLCCFHEIYIFSRHARFKVHNSHWGFWKLLMLARWVLRWTGSVRVNIFKMSLVIMFFIRASSYSWYN